MNKTKRNTKLKAPNYLILKSNFLFFNYYFKFSRSAVEIDDLIDSSTPCLCP